MLLVIGRHPAGGGETEWVILFHPGQGYADSAGGAPDQGHFSPNVPGRAVTFSGLESSNGTRKMAPTATLACDMIRSIPRCTLLVKHYYPKC